MSQVNNYKAVAVKAAQAHGLDPQVFLRQINAESNFNPNAGSGAGAVGIAQFMPATAKSLGINPRDPVQSLNGAAKLMAGYVKKYGSMENALRAYNAGEGAIAKSHGYGETNAYVQKILHGPAVSAPGASSTPASIGGLAATRGSTSSKTTTTSNAADVAAAEQDNQRRTIVLSLITKHRGPNSLLVKSGVLAPKPVPGLQTMASTRITKTPGVPGTPGAPTSATASPATGAKATLTWAKSTIGVAETTGANRGPRVDSWEQRFGLKGQPWCAVFTSLAVTKGGVARSGRTASVAEVRNQAQQGSAAYQRGFVPPQQAHAGDLILFGNDHIGLVESVGKGGITMIAGNDSNKVQRRTVALGAGDIVRPKYKQ